MLRLNRILPPAALWRGALSTQPPLHGWRIWLLSMALAGAAVEGRNDGVAAELRDFALRTWSRADGLPDASVTVVQQTQDGYLWVGTAAGLVRFDGVKFTQVA